ncbi:hypothetical protein BP6252_06406 [Coleophoma cylindrospora]|uniref:Uncharacterized protein n=1 Tax=Coleophoma cylindrospora TaxID=1849047 RepID=A0A3D8RMY0_9HELO|nr:hypothetical protein BP6252_06406 [Coleophoma cylindrospora]
MGHCHSSKGSIPGGHYRHYVETAVQAQATTPQQPEQQLYPVFYLVKLAERGDRGRISFMVRCNDRIVSDPKDKETVTEICTSRRAEYGRMYTTFVVNNTKPCISCDRPAEKLARLTVFQSSQQPSARPRQIVDTVIPICQNDYICNQRANEILHYCGYGIRSVAYMIPQLELALKELFMGGKETVPQFFKVSLFEQQLDCKRTSVACCIDYENQNIIVVY